MASGVRGGWRRRAAALWLRWFPAGRPKARPRDVRRQLWSHSTRRMGVRFTERVRHVFRNRWLRVAEPDRAEDRDR
jgi:hypothetical protein